MKVAAVRVDEGGEDIELVCVPARIAMSKSEYNHVPVPQSPLTGPLVLPYTMLLVLVLVHGVVVRHATPVGEPDVLVFRAMVENASVP